MPRRAFRRPSRPQSLESLEPRRLLSGAAPVPHAMGPWTLAQLRAAVDAGFVSLKDNPVSGLFDGDHDHDHRETLSENFHLDSGFHSDLKGLTVAGEGDVAAATLDLLRGQAARFSLRPGDFDGAVVTDLYTTEPTGVTHLYLRQTLDGLEIANANMNVNIARDGSILSVGGAFVSGLADAAVDAPEGRLAPLDALRAIADDLEVNPLRGARVVSAAESLDQRLTIEAPDFSLDPIPGRLHYVARPDGLQLGWEFIVRVPGGSDWWELTVDAGDGRILRSANYTSHATYRVIPAPVKHPLDGAAADGQRVLLTDPHDPLASPFGWHDTNGVAGAESTETRGNNVNAQEDANGNNGTGAAANGGAGLAFDFPLDLAQAPSVYRNASLTNLFYWSNLIHDVTYRYGFTEVAGNFQTNNYGRGGAGNDAVLADGQDGSGTNNANFSTPADGSPPRMQMFLWTQTTPGRDGSLDNMIIVHEYGHGISNRLTGGPANSSALSGPQARGMGEGWSDFLGLMFTMEAGDQPGGRYGVGTYSLGQANDGVGIRRFPYSYDMSIDPLTFADYNVSSTNTSVHRTGELWCAALFDMYWLLVDRYGFNSDFAAGWDPANPGGNTLAMRLVLDGMKLQPAVPGFIAARNAILQADQVLTGGANQFLIWQAFARRGLGFSASTTSNTSSSITVAFDVPSPNPLITGHTPNTQAVAPVPHVDFVFNEPMDPTSFSIADDVVSFTGPGGVDLLDHVNGFAWLAANTLRLTLDPANAIGDYTLVIGPNILAADDGAAMDQSLDGVPGGGDDAYSATYTFNPFIGPEGFGYQAGGWFFDPALDLVAGEPGVLSVLDGADDASAAIDLGVNVFNFYGVAYTGANRLFANTNGLLSLDSGTNSYTNSDLTDTPTQRAIAVFWDDLVTNASATDRVLARFDDLDGDGVHDRLVIEWSDIRRFSATANGGTFQAILQLNTGAEAGSIILNYADLDFGDARYNNGKSASAGIKDAAAQGANRLLVARDTDLSPYVGTARAVRISTDWTPPTVAEAAFDYDEPAHRVRVRFSDDVFSALPSGALTLTNLTTGAAVGDVNASLVGDDLLLTFPSAPDGRLARGDYRLTLEASAFADRLGNFLDGDDDGFGGGNFALEFFHLPGDANRDRRVDVADLGIVATHWQQSGRSYDDGDFNYDGVVDVADLGILATAWQDALGPALAGAAGPALPPAVGASLFSRTPISARGRVADDVIA